MVVECLRVGHICLFRECERPICSQLHMTEIRCCPVLCPFLSSQGIDSSVCHSDKYEEQHHQLLNLQAEKQRVKSHVPFETARTNVTGATDDSLVQMKSAVEDKTYQPSDIALKMYCLNFVHLIFHLNHICTTWLTSNESDNLTMPMTKSAPQKS